MAIFIFSVLVLAALCLFLYNQNNQLLLNKREIPLSRLPLAFDGLRVLHVSDLHNKSFGEHQERLLYLTRKASPDLIIVSGDLLYRRKDGAFKAALEYIRGASKIAPVYFSPGNHEALAPKDYAVFSHLLSQSGVNILANREVRIVRGGQSISLLGIPDPYAYDPEDSDNASWISALHDMFPVPPENFSILISHRPEKFPFYVESGVDLVLSGHAHGGQVRLPFIHGLFAPQQGIFPRTLPASTKAVKLLCTSAAAWGKAISHSEFLIARNLFY